MTMERQTTFGWPIAVDVFLAGAGGGVFLISFLLILMNKYVHLAGIGTLVGPLLVIVGAVILFVDLGAKGRLHRLFYNPSSWMTRGTWLITAFILFGFAYWVATQWLSVWNAEQVGMAIGVIAALLAVLVTIYPGFLLSAVKRIPLWNTAALPILFFFSSLCSGMGILLFISPLSVTAQKSGLFALVIGAISLILMQSLLIGVFLEGAGQGGSAEIKSVRLLKRPLFIGGVMIGGLAIPLALLAYQALTHDTIVTLVLAGVLLLAGNLVLRYCILTAGVRLPLYPP